MCKFCEIELGYTATIEEHEYKTMLGDKVRDEDRYSVGLLADDNDEPNYYIVAAHYSMSTGRDYDVMEIPIQYCPFCGRKLHNVDSLI